MSILQKGIEGSNPSVSAISFTLPPSALRASLSKMVLIGEKFSKSVVFENCSLIGFWVASRPILSPISMQEIATAISREAQPMEQSQNNFWTLRLRRSMLIFTFSFFTMCMTISITATFGIGPEYMQSHSTLSKTFAITGLVFLIANFRQTILFTLKMAFFGWSLKINDKITTVLTPKKTIQINTNSIINVRWLNAEEVNPWQWPANKPSILRLELDDGRHQDVFANNTVENGNEIIDTIMHFAN
ncbi:MAG: hypothetical protein FD163_1843 [Hyphomonadaceae bacterium]|nr:MAG: hypothetical protein FD128_2093 [Hyphomonadaceae bacterium]KAF0184269.1 MAG: hypothetical protein FD163_1843 [Hyphomonadaceae bacterium]